MEALRAAFPFKAYIPGTEHRGITKGQLRHVVDYATRHCVDWYDDAPPSRIETSGQGLSMAVLNLYHLNTWLIMPATEPQVCSVVELMSFEAQTPQWFCSHWWGEVVHDFLMCVERHADVRQAARSTPYWVCAYANRQHALEHELAFDPRNTSFFRAMQCSVGVLIILDDCTVDSRGATAFTRIWCAFEASVAVTQEGRSAPMLVDVCAVHADAARLLTDGLTLQEQAMVPALGWHAKHAREADFPLELMRRGLSIRVELAEATDRIDKARILNAIAGVSDLDAEPPNTHPAFDRVNRSLAATFAIRCWHGALGSEDLLQELQHALEADLERTEAMFSFVGQPEFTDAQLCALAQALPLSTRSLRLHVGFCPLIRLEGLSGALGRLTKLRKLEVHFFGLGELESVAEVPKALMQLTRLDEFCFSLSTCPMLEDVGDLRRGIGALKRVIALTLSISHCPMMRDITGVSVAIMQLRLRHLVDVCLDLRDCEALPADVRGMYTSATHFRFKLMWYRFRHGLPMKTAPALTVEMVAVEANVSEAPGFEDHEEVRRPTAHGPGAVRQFTRLVSPPSQPGRPSLSLHHSTVDLIVRASRATVNSVFAEKPFPCSFPGCPEFHVNGGGYCPNHSHAWLFLGLRHRFANLRQQFDLLLMATAMCSLEMSDRSILAFFAMTLAMVAGYDIFTSFGLSGMAMFLLLVILGLCEIARAATLVDRMDQTARDLDCVAQCLVADALSQGGHASEPDMDQLGPEPMGDMRVLIPHGSNEQKQMYHLARKGHGDFESMITDAFSHLDEDALSMCRVDLLSLHHLELVSCGSRGRWEEGAHNWRASVRVTREVDGVRGVLSCVVVATTVQHLRSCWSSLEGLSAQDKLSIVGVSNGFRAGAASDGYRHLCANLRFQGLPASVEIHVEALMEVRRAASNAYGKACALGLVGAEPLRGVVADRQSGPLPWRVWLSVMPLRIGTAILAAWLAGKFWLTWSDTASDRKKGSDRRRLVATILVLPYAAILFLLCTDIFRSGRVVRRSRIVRLYEEHLGMLGTHYLDKTLVLQSMSVLLQAWGKLPLMSGMVTLIRRECKGESCSASFKQASAWWWLFAVALAFNCTYPPLLLYVDPKSMHVVAAFCEAVLGFMYTGGYIGTASLAVELDQDVHVYNFQTNHMKSVRWKFMDIELAFPHYFFGYLAVFVPVLKLFSIPRALERAARWKSATDSVARSASENNPRAHTLMHYPSSLPSLDEEETEVMHRLRSRGKIFWVLTWSVSISCAALYTDRFPFSESGSRCFPCVCVEDTLTTCRLAQDLGFRGLDLSRMGIAHVSTTAFHNLEDLEVLQLSHNNITLLEGPMFANLAKLEYLSLHNNNIRRLLPGSFDNLKGLVRLDLWYNKIERIEEASFCGLNSLLNFDLFGNHIVHVHANAFDGLSALKVLSLRNNIISDLDVQALTGLKSLELLYVDTNLLTRFDARVFHGLPKLRDVTLYCNPFLGIDYEESLMQLPSLKFVRWRARQAIRLPCPTLPLGAACEDDRPYSCSNEPIARLAACSKSNRTAGCAGVQKTAWSPFLGKCLTRVSASPSLTWCRLVSRRSRLDVQFLWIAPMRPAT